MRKIISFHFVSLAFHSLVVLKIVSDDEVYDDNDDID